MNEEPGRREYMELHGDGYALHVYVRRPPEVEAQIDALSEEPGPNWGRSPKQIEQDLLSEPARKMMELVRLQAARLDPENPARIAEAKDKLEAAFAFAFGLAPIYMEKIPNEYCGAGSVGGVREPWWMVTTRIGHIKIGWRKRVINIDWSRTEAEKDPEKLFADEQVTKGHSYIHAWSCDKAAEYLKRLADTCVGRDRMDEEKS